MSPYLNQNLAETNDFKYYLRYAIFSTIIDYHTEESIILTINRHFDSFQRFIVTKITLNHEKLTDFVKKESVYKENLEKLRGTEIFALKPKF